MTSILHFVLSLVVIGALAVLASSNRKAIRLRYVFQLLVIQIALAYFFLNSNVGSSFVLGVASVFTHLLG
ncbi:Na+ dependent nucleoside transporter N-terminal domain-containing protein, partial [Escherichia coli]